MMAISDSDTQIWRARGLGLLFGFAVANLIGALMSFVAHNWTYLSTGLKLGGLAALLLAAAGVWVLRRFDSRSAQSFGIAAQVLIGIWLAAAGQIYQAPGGLQDLLLTWALLGLPFALASRAPAHWAVWFAVVAAFGLSATGVTLRQFLNRETAWFASLVAALILSSGLLARLWRGETGWLNTALGATIAILGVSIAIRGWSSLGLTGPLALAVLSLVGWHVYRRGEDAATLLLAAAGSGVALMLIGDTLNDLGLPTTILFFLLAAFTAGATHFLLRLHAAMGTSIQADAAKPAVDERDAPNDGQDTPARPWYLSAIVGAGGVVTALFTGGLIGAIIALSGLLESHWESVTLLIGVLAYVGGLIGRRTSHGVFLSHLLGTLILVGVGAVVLGVFGFLDDLSGRGLGRVGALAIVLALAAAVAVRRDGLFHGLMALIGIGGLAMIVTSLTNGSGETTIWLLLSWLYAIIGLVFALQRVGGERRPAIAALFFLAAMVVRLILHAWTISDGSIIRPVALEPVGDLILMSAAILWLWVERERLQLPYWPVLLAFLGFGLWLPGGGAAALLLLLIGYAHRTLPMFLLGVASVAGYFLFFYLDLSLTLMQVSAFMAVTGAVLLGLWWIADRRVSVPS